MEFGLIVSLMLQVVFASFLFAVDVPCQCDLNAECYRDNNGGNYCVCKLGFRGDGKQCQGEFSSFASSRVFFNIHSG